MYVKWFNLTGKQYKNPPIVEAICEFKLVESEPWDWTIPGMLYSRIKDEFPEKQEIRGFGVEFSLNRENPISTRYSDTIDRLQFWSEDKERVVQVGENRLIINKRKPYEGWEDFLSFITKINEEYTEVVESDRIEGFSLRYINKIESLDDDLKLKDYFLISPEFPKNLGEPARSLSVQGEFEVELDDNVNSTIILRFFKQRIPDDDPKNDNWIIDITLNAEARTDLVLNQVTDLLSNAHEHVTTTFESSITDRLRETFEEE